MLNKIWYLITLSLSFSLFMICRLNFILHIIGVFFIEEAFVFFLNLFYLFMIIIGFIFNIRFPFRFIYLPWLVLLINLLKYFQPPPPLLPSLIVIISWLIYNRNIRQLIKCNSWDINNYLLKWWSLTAIPCSKEISCAHCIWEAA